ncbi:hypothetical protein [Candidatus Pyrohabitans sp.]
MLGKSYVLLGIGVVALFVGVVYTIALSTGKLVDTQTELLSARIQGEIGEEQYAQRSQEAEQGYRQEVAEALERLAGRLGEVAQNVPEGNATRNITMLAQNLSAAIESFRGGE